MRKQMPKQIDVLIVGAGPVGLTLACQLTACGLTVRLIEQKAARDPWSKAAAIQPRTLEVFAQMGIVQRFLDEGVRVTGLNLFQRDQRLAHLELTAAGTRYPFILGQSQIRTEELLEARLQELGGAIERPTALISFEQDELGVTARLMRESGRPQRVRATWLVGCDGAHSTVRHQLGLSFDGSTFPMRLVQADVRVSFPVDVPPGEGAMFFSDQGPLGCIPLFEPGRYRVIAIDPGSDDEPDLEMFDRIVAARGAPGMQLSDPHWFAGFHFHGRLAERYRVGRVFLAGDAAHIHSPVGGQGMNTGIQDAFNLAWKLALVDRGRARPALLDSYERERKPVAANVVSRTDRATKTVFRTMTSRNRAFVGLRNQVAALLFNSGFFGPLLFRGLSGISLGYSTSPAVGEHHTSIWSARLDADGADELPGMGSWLRFSKAPGPGDRVPDLELPGGESLFKYLGRDKHLMLIFDGYAGTDEGYQRMLAIGDRVRVRFGALVDVALVVPRDARPAPLARWQGALLCDAQHELHEAFGAASEALYLIRPDGHVGYRSQPASAEHLASYLDHLFDPVPEMRQAASATLD